MTIPQYYIAALPLIVAVVDGWLNDDGLAAWANSIITLIILVGVAWAWASTNALFTHDLVTNIVIIAGIIAALVYVPGSPLYALRRWLILNTPSPISKLPQSVTIPVRPTAPPPIAQRTSRLAPGSQYVAATPTQPVQPTPAANVPMHYEDTAAIPVVDVLRLTQSAQQPSSPSQPSIILPPPSESPPAPIYPAYSQPTQPPPALPS